jgi:hypothetical protein
MNTVDYIEMYEQYLIDKKPLYFWDYYNNNFNINEYCEKDKIMIKMDNLRPKTARITCYIVDYIFVSSGFNDVKELNKELEQGEFGNKFIIKKTYDSYDARIKCFINGDLKFANKTNDTKIFNLVKHFYFKKEWSKFFNLETSYFF